MTEPAFPARLPADFAKRVLGAAKAERRRLDRNRRRFLGVGMTAVVALALMLPALPVSVGGARDPDAGVPAAREELAWLTGTTDSSNDGLRYLMPEAASESDDSE